MKSEYHTHFLSMIKRRSKTRVTGADDESQRFGKAKKDLPVRSSRSFQNLSDRGADRGFWPAPGISALTTSDELTTVR